MSKDEQIELLRSQLKEAQSHQVVLQQQLEWLKKQLFSSGKSEKMDKNQILLQLQITEEKLKKADQQTQTVLYERKVGSRKSKAESYEHLPVLETETIVAEEVQQAPEAFEQISEERTFEVKLDPPKFYRKEIIRPKYRRKEDKESAPVIAPAPIRPVHGIASASLLTYILISKYCDHLPLFRQEKMYQRLGCSISRSSMCRWIEQCSELLKPIYHCMHQNLIDGNYLQVDETPVNVLEPDRKLGKARKAYLWPISKPAGDVVFSWSLTRSSSHLEDLLSGFSGYLQCDGYAGYKSYADDNRDRQITLVACMAHIRRKFFEAQTDQAALPILQKISQLYKIEKQLRDKNATTQEILQTRQKQSTKIVKKLKNQILQTAQESLPQSLTGKACQYALGQWSAMENYLQDGQIQIDNNLIENAIRPSAIGKKNWLFIAHPQAGERSAILYSLIVSCQRHGINPSHYLEDVLTQMPNLPNRDCSQLTPQNWAKSNIKELQTA